MSYRKKEAVRKWFDLLGGNIEKGELIDLPVVSGSMMPVLILNKHVRIRADSCKNAAPGDIIVFRSGSSLISHRLLFRVSLAAGSFLYQKGDTEKFGSFIKGGRVVGIVTAIQNENDEYIELSDHFSKKQARKKAMLEIARTLYNTALIIPRSIKRCFTGKQKSCA